jgi:hypothetical protein
MDEAIHERMHGQAFLSFLRESNRYNTINSSVETGEHHRNIGHFASFT